MTKCINCNKSFNPQRSTAKYCSDTCRKEYSRKKVSVTKDEVSVTTPREEATKTPVKSKSEVSVTDDRFGTPNWKRNGFKNKHEAVAKAIKDLMGNKKIGTSPDGSPITVSWQGRSFVIGK